MKQVSFARKSALRLPKKQSRFFSEGLRGKDRPKLELKPGDELKGWRVIKTEFVPDFHLNAVRLSHLKTGAEYLHIDCEDTNNVFSVTFRTPPSDSTGVPHILEHTTLCGSERYPVRDPFFNMLKRSMNTFMNAWTASDHTSYPFSSQNAKDFGNLMGVYLDATFFPLLSESDFRQEGHRLEFAEPQDPSSPLSIKGVVYNEMKGAMADPSHLFAIRLQQALHPNTPYSHNSGGEPRNIPDLTYEQLRAFHRAHYHPSNARFFTYGDLPLSSHLDFIEEHALKRFERTTPPPPLPDEARLAEPKTIYETCPQDPMNPDDARSTKMSIAFLTNKITDPYEAFSMRLLSNLLLEGPSAPLYQALIDSQLAPEYAPGTGYDTSVREAALAIGVQGISNEDVGQVEKVVFETLERAAKEGFEPQRIEAELHQVELSLKHVSSNFGLAIASSVMYSWVHGGDPVSPLYLSSFVDRLRSEVAQGGFFESRIRKYLLDNKHRVTLIMSPDEEYVQKQTKVEQDRVAAIQQSLTEKQKEDIVNTSLDLKARQEQKQDISVLPTLHLSDIPRPIANPTKLAKQSFSIAPTAPSVTEADLYTHELNTNGIIYYRTLFGLDLDAFPKHLLPFLPIFTAVLSKVGAADMNYIQLSQAIDLHTGGVDASSLFIPDPNHSGKYQFAISLGSHCLPRNTERMFDLLTKVLTSPNFTDPNRLRNLVAQSAVNLSNSIPDSGTSYAASHAAAALGPMQKYQELFGGITHVQFMTNLAASLEGELGAESGTPAPTMSSPTMDLLIASLSEISRCVLAQQSFNKSLLVSSSTSDSDSAKSGFLRLLDSQKDWILGRAPKNPSTAQPSSAALDLLNLDGISQKSFFGFPIPVNYVAKTWLTVPTMHPDSPKLQIAAQLLSSNFLHREVREKGGAYGGSASLGNSGVLCMASFRDPHTLSTLQTFDSAADYVLNTQFSDKEIEEAKLECFQGSDRPVPPGRRGLSEFAYGLTDEMRQLRRDRLFEVTKNDVREVALKYLKEASTPSAQCIFGAEEKIPKEISDSKDWKVTLSQEN